MIKRKKMSLPAGVWSAAPTPFNDQMEIDEPALGRMLKHDRQLGINGYFIAGSNGEGPWLRDEQRWQLLRYFVKHAKGRVPLAMQVTDNSAARMLDNIAMAHKLGADIAVIAPPYFVYNQTPKHILSIYLETIRKSPLPIGIYDRGLKGTVAVNNAMIKKICAEPQVVMLKDSSTDMSRIGVLTAIQRQRPELVLLNGWEFNCLPYLQAGYNGLLLGGAVFNALLAHQIINAAQAKNLADAEKLQARMNRMMADVYGGKKNVCWLAGEKQLLVEMGIFRTTHNYPQYQLTDSCRRSIQRVLKREAEYLKP